MGSVIFRNQIGSRLISSFNKQIKTELTFDAINLDVFSGFPYAKTELTNVLIEDLNGDSLLEANSLRFRIKIADLIRSRYMIRDLKISGGEINWLINESGENNYNIFKEEKAQDNSINFDKAILQDVEMSFINKEHLHSGVIDIRQMTLEGAFAGNELNLATDAQLTSRFIEVQGQKFLQNEAISFKAPLEINTTDKVFEFKNGELLINDNLFRINGDFQSWENGNYIDLFMNSEDSKLEGVLQLLPDMYTDLVGSVKSDQNISFSAWIKGILGRVERPEVKAELKLTNSQIELPKFETTIDSSSMMVVLNNGELRNMESAYFEIRDFVGFLEGEPINMGLRLESLDNPSIDLNFDGSLPFKMVYPYFQDKKFKVDTGSIVFDDFSLRGRYENMIDPSLSSLIESSGQLRVQDLLLRSEKDSILIPSGLVNIADNKLTLSDLIIQGFDSDLSMNAVAFNTLPVLLADSLNSELAELEFELEISAKKLALDKFLVGLDLAHDINIPDSIAQDTERTNAIQKHREYVSTFLKGNIAATVDSFYYGEVKGSNFAGTMEFINSDVQMSGEASIFGGKARVDGQLELDIQPQLEVILDLEEIKIKPFLQKTNQLYQKSITADNISGTLSSKTLLTAYWNDKDEFQMNKFRARGILDLKNGQLDSIDIISTFANSLKTKELEQLKFKAWQSYLEIRRGKVYLPMTIIKSKDLNLIASTEQQFNGKYRYNIQLYTRANLAKTLAQNNPDLTPIRSNTEGYYNYYYSLFGKDPTDFNKRIANKAVKADFERSKIRGKEILQVLQQSFPNLKPVEYPTDWEDKPIIKEEIIFPIDTIAVDTTSQ